MTRPIENQPRAAVHIANCAVLTPRGRGAVAVVGVAGPQSCSILDSHFLPANKLPLSKNLAKPIIYGIWKPTGEDLVIHHRGKNRFEVHCHGGRLAVTAILDSLVRSGASLVSAIEFALEFENAWHVEVQRMLTQATTLRTAELLLNQLTRLPNAIAELDVLIDAGQIQSAVLQVEKMLTWSSFGIHLTHPRSIVFCGRPNVGKSSLANAVIGFERAIVHNAPGTTRDVVSQLTAIDGWPVELKDTAGLRQATDVIESLGIEKAKSQIDSANIRVGVFDGASPWSESDDQTLKSINAQLIVHNKSDLAIKSAATDIHRPEGLSTSAKTGQGIAELTQQLGTLMVPNLPTSSEAYPVSEAQTIQLQTVLSLLLEGKIDPAKKKLMDP